MYKEDFKLTVMAAVLGVIGLGLASVSLINQSDNQEYIFSGQLVNKEVTTVGAIGRTGGTGAMALKLSFKLDSDQEINMYNQPFCAPLNPGDRVNIFYRKGVLFKNIRYDYCKPQ